MRPIPRVIRLDKSACFLKLDLLILFHCITLLSLVYTIKILLLSSYFQDLCFWVCSGFFIGLCSPCSFWLNLYLFKKNKRINKQKLYSRQYMVHYVPYMMQPSISDRAQSMTNQGKKDLKEKHIFVNYSDKRVLCSAPQTCLADCMYKKKNLRKILSIGA